MKPLTVLVYVLYISIMTIVIIKMCVLLLWHENHPEHSEVEKMLKKDWITPDKEDLDNTKSLNKTGNLSSAIKTEYNKMNNTKMLEQVVSVLKDLNRIIFSKVTVNQTHGSIFAQENQEQLKSYLNEIDNFQKQFPIHTICETGFSGGHSATVFLEATRSTNASYFGFDIWDKPLYEDAALDWVKKKYSHRNVTVVKGDSTKTVPLNKDLKGKCELIHIDGAHYGNFPKMDIINMAKLAANKHLLLVDDCTKSMPAVLDGVNYATHKKILVSKPRIIIADGWIFRDMMKGWCVGEYITS